MKTTKERFEEKYIPEPNSGCWLWIGAMGNLYGVIVINGRNIRAHRCSWTLYKSSIPEGMCVLHRCDIPTCVNPDHLFLGTHLDNMRDKIKKGRGVSPKGELCGAAKLTNKEVLEIRKLLKDGVNHSYISKMYNTSKTNVNSIKNKKSWLSLLDKEVRDGV